MSDRDRGRGGRDGGGRGGRDFGGRDGGGRDGDYGGRDGDGGRGGGKPIRVSSAGKAYVDYKDVDALRRTLSPNGKIYGRKRLGTTAREQRMVARAVKRARYMGLLPYTSATV